MYSRDKVLVDVARKRLQAIFEASELGAGFKIAMRDMEIRGAGDILGARQHGHIAAVGFDLYTKLLAQAIQERRETGGGRQKMEDGRRETGDGRRKTGDEESRTENRLPSSVLRPPSDSVTLDLPLEAHIPSEYVAQEEMRLRLYRRMAELTSLEAVEEFAQELKDRFGPVPQATLHLLYLVRVKVWALQAGIEAIVYDPANDRITVRVRERMKLLEWRPSREVEKAVSVWRNTVTIGKHGNLGEIRGNKGDGDWREVLEEVVRGLAT
jgi:transcription-repair coupling factor (superfamily II helicase)